MDSSSYGAVDEEGLRFTLTDRSIGAELTYHLSGDRLVLTHAGVPPEHRNQGIAGVLVQAAVDRAAESGETIVPQCPYVRAWLEDHPDQADRVNVEWGPRRS